jgi:site-specific DNA-methyltransferase (adenine-specific)
MTHKRKEQLSEGVTLYLGDCREVMPLIGKVDAVVTDPPYGINFRHGGGGSKKGLRRLSLGATNRLKYRPKNRAIIGDDNPFDPSDIISLGIPTILWGGNHFANSLPASKGWIVWDKSREGAYEGLSFAEAELAWTNLRINALMHRQLWRGLTKEGEEANEARCHPTQKPIRLMVKCINLLPDTPKTILDPFMGSGTTGVACVRLERGFIGIELDEQYFDIACRRIEDELKRPRLPLPEIIAPQIQEAML